MVDGKFSLLLIEDNPLDAELTRSRLEAGGLDFCLDLADSRAAFEAAIASKAFDLILADYSLPDFDGLSALEIIRKRDKRLPFIFVSGVLGEDVAVETLLRGATDYVLKQRMDRLVPAVNRALSEHAAFLSQERAEHELRKVEKRFELLTNALPAMVWTAQRDGSLRFVNSQWMRCVGPAKSPFDPELLHPRDVETCRRVWRNALATGEPFDVDCRYRILADGSFRWHLVRGIPTTDGDGVAEWVGTCTDTEQQRNREAHMRTNEKLALTGRLASVIAHEINNPLEALTNVLYLLSSGTLDDGDSRSYFHIAEQELLRISAITKQTLQWSREEAVVASVSMESIVDEALKLFGRKLHNKGVHLRRVFEAHPSVRVAAGELRQVVSNLISNAIDAVSAGGEITVRVLMTERGGATLAELAVQDNGTGMTEEQVAQMFQPFQSTKGSLGSGLGLFISKELVERYGGELVAETRFGHGTTMRVLLPPAAAAAAVPHK